MFSVCPWGLPKVPTPLAKVPTPQPAQDGGEGYPKVPTPAKVLTPQARYLPSCARSRQGVPQVPTPPPLLRETGHRVLDMLRAVGMSLAFTRSRFCGVILFKEAHNFPVCPHVY